ADLVVDATGRGSRTPVFLEQLGYDRPAEDEVVVNLAYACQPVRVAPGSIEENFIAIFPEPGRPKMFAAIGYENDIAMFAVGAMAGLHPPRTAGEMLTFAADCAPAAALAAFADAVPTGEVAHHRVPSNRWRRYDKIRRLPDGLIVLGDAICSFNPIYGQGMTVAAIESIVLRDCLSRGDRDLPRRFFRSSAKKIRIAWQSATGSDLALPEVKGTVPLSMRLSNAYLDQVMTAAETDPTVMLRFMRVIGLIDSPAKLLSPAFMFRVVKSNRLRRRRDSEPQPPGVTGVADRFTPVPESLSE
ncbi:2-polyprenyl-6-methoxyphenol hydroxylase-like oxidoreductase, partial [Mycobacterium sp. ITM-2017-0098]